LGRDLIYDYRDWQTIEAIGRNGSDEGNDIRPFQKKLSRTSVDDETDEFEEASF
jgi:hypothetical protein